MSDTPDPQPTLSDNDVQALRALLLTRHDDGADLGAILRTVEQLLGAPPINPADCTSLQVYLLVVSGVKRLGWRSGGLWNVETETSPPEHYTDSQVLVLRTAHATDMHELGRPVISYSTEGVPSIASGNLIAAAPDLPRAPFTMPPAVEIAPRRPRPLTDQDYELRVTSITDEARASQPDELELDNPFDAVEAAV